MLIIAVAGGFDWGPTPVGIGIGMVAGLTAIFASLVATCNQRRAARIDLWVVLALGASAWFLSLPWFFPIGDCGGRPLLDDYGVPRGIDFTARLLFVGPRTYLGRSLWSLASVEEPFQAHSRKSLSCEGFSSRAIDPADTLLRANEMAAS
jgi:hypothetical protein